MTVEFSKFPECIRKVEISLENEIVNDSFSPYFFQVDKMGSWSWHTFCSLITANKMYALLDLWIF
jgi:hypothetical protein